MAAVAERAPVRPEIFAEAPFALQDAELLQGPKSYVLQRAIGDVYSYWVRLDPTLTADGGSREYGYRSMPPKRTIRMLVTMRVRGRANPLPYEVGDDWTE